MHVSPRFQGQGPVKTLMNARNNPAFGCSAIEAPRFGCETVSTGWAAVHGGHIVMGVAAGLLTAVAASAVVFRDKIAAFFSDKQG